MQSSQHQNIVGFIWNIANKLRGPYRPPQYRRVMLPLIMLRRLDLVLAENKHKVLEEKARLEAKGMTGSALDAALARIATGDRKQALYNTSGFTFEKLLGDAPNIAGNLIAYIHGFSPRARDIFEKFEFESEIAKLDEANRLYLIIQEFCSADINLSPNAISNLQMGYLFEELVRKFNEQADEEAGDHFTPREVIRLMVNLIFTGEDGIYEKGIYRSVYDPTAGTGGMLSEAEKFICGDGVTSGMNPDANIELFGQEYNPESYAICCADLLIKDEPIDNLIYGDTIGVKDAKNKTNGFVAQDGHPDKRFHYMLSNPPFGVEWKPEEAYVRQEYAEQGFAGRFGAGLPRINEDGSLFLRITNVTRDSINLKLADIQYVMPPDGAEGRRTATVSNDVIISITADLGSVAVVPDSVTHAYVSQHLALVRPQQQKVSGRWMAYQVFSLSGKAQLLGAGYGGSKIQLSLGDVKDVWIAIPSTDEQNQISQKLDLLIERMDLQIEKVKSAIGTLKEYRTTLITNAVTGKIDVRNITIPSSGAADA